MTSSRETRSVQRFRDAISRIFRMDDSLSLIVFVVFGAVVSFCVLMVLKIISTERTDTTN